MENCPSSYENRLMEIAAQAMSAPEREAVRALLAAIEAVPPDRDDLLGAATNLMTARGRAERIRESNRRADGLRRKLVGARLRREEVAAYERAAAARGQSVYAWVTDALRAALSQQTIDPESH